MSKEKWKTAEEIMAANEKNPEFQRRAAERAERRKARAERAAAQERPTLERLDALGFELSAISEAAAKYAPLPASFVEVLLDAVKLYAYVKEYTYSNVLEMMIRQLAAAAEPFDGRPLMECYEKNKDWNIRWVICNTIVFGKPHSIDAWIDKERQNPEFAKTLSELGYKKARKGREKA